MLLFVQSDQFVLCNGLRLGRDKILKFVNSESAQNFDVETTFFEWPSSKVK